MCGPSFGVCVCGDDLPAVVGPQTVEPGLPDRRRGKVHGRSTTLEEGFMYIGLGTLILIIILLIILF